MKTQKNAFLIYLHRFSHFQRHLKRIKIFKGIWNAFNF